MDGIGLIAGQWGTAEPMTVPGVPYLAPVLQHWLVTPPHPPQFVLALSSLRDFPGLRPAGRDWPAATHEISVIPFDPAPGRLTTGGLLRMLTTGRLPVMPGGVRCQVEATDAEVTAVMPLLAEAITRQGWNPGIGPNGDRLRIAWREGIDRQLTVVRSRRPAQPPAVQWPAPAGGTWA